MSDKEENQFPRHPMLDADVQTERTGARVVAFGSGKEGSANRLSRRILRSVWGGRRRVLPCSTATSGASLHSFLGVGFPGYRSPTSFSVESSISMM